MSILILPIAIAFASIHYINGGDFTDLLNLASVVFMIWMLDIVIRLGSISISIRRK